MGNLIPTDDGRRGVARPVRADLAPTDGGPNPLMMLSPAFLDDFMVLWACNRTLLPTDSDRSELCARLSIYAQRGLTAADWKAVVARMLQPERQAKHKFKTDFLTDLAALVADAIRTRRVREEMQAYLTRATLPPAQRIVVNLADRFRV